MQTTMAAETTLKNNINKCSNSSGVIPEKSLTDFFVKGSE